VATSPDYSPVCSPDTSGPSGTSPDSLGPIPIAIGAAADLFWAAKAAEGASPRTLEWYQMIVGRAVRRFGEARPVDTVPAAELRASLAPESIAGYVRGLKAFGNWCATEEVAAAGGFRGLRRPKVPHRLIAPFSDPELRSLLALADERERALSLVLLDTRLRLSELASLRVGDVRPDGTLQVMGKGANLALIGYPVPEDAAPGKVGETIRVLRRRLEQGLPLTTAQQARWKRLVEHNRHDRAGMRRVCIQATTELDPTST
jgi:integrase